MNGFHVAKSTFLVLQHFRLNLGRCCSQALGFSHDQCNTSGADGSKNNDESVYPASKNFPRRVPLTAEEYETRKTLTPVQPDDPHLLKVALMGDPNAGKSTLANSLVKWKVCAVSKKVHTTRRKACAMLVEGNKQIVFLDTPGFVTPEHSKKHKLEVSLVVDPKHSAESADLIAVVIDAANKWANKTISPSILTLLENSRNKTSILILNKVDAVKSKEELLQTVRVLTEQTKAKKKESQCTSVGHQNKGMNKFEMLPLPKYFPDVQESGVQCGWPSFSQVFMVSALENSGVDQLREFMLSLAKPAPWMYNASDVTDQHPHQIAIHLIREKLLDFLPKEIPYGLSVKITSWILDPSGALRITVVIKCPNARHKRLVIGRGGMQIANCVQNSRQSIADAFRCEVLLKIEVK